MTNPPNDKGNLTRMALVRLVGGLGFVAALFFLCAGTLDYWQAWLYFGVLALMMTATFIWLVQNDPQRLERRLRMQEREKAQKWIIGVAVLLCTLIFVLPGLDRRFAWSQVPTWLALLGLALAIAGYGLYVRVIQVNRYASRVVEVDNGQQVIDSGPYRLVRHPMYLGMQVFLAATALALASYWALIPALGMIPVLAMRAAQEEGILRRELPGYAAYTHRVRWRIIPGIW